MSAESTNQRLLPLFALATGLMVVGFYIAFSQSPDSDHKKSSSNETTFEKDLEAVQSDRELEPTAPSDEAFQFQYQPNKTKYTVQTRLRQTTKTNSKKSHGQEKTSILESELSARATEETRDIEGKNLLRSKRSVDAFHIVLKDNGEQLGDTITRQLESSVPGAKLYHRIRTDGQIEKSTWDAVVNPQVKRLLTLYSAADQLLQPRFRVGKILPGDTWSHSSKIPVKFQEIDGIELGGKLKTQNQFEGISKVDNRKIGVIRQTLSAKYSGKQSQKERAVDYNLEGDGTGLVLYNLENDVVIYQEATLEYRTRFSAEDDQNEQNTSIKFVRTRSPIDGDS